mmetsp:Transcript_49100/g.72951  ORF Transcript_49100/g.72951 Transcript_49100/m.72951 type:complete len:314 (-) Transcript_49100:60-1001(-)
MRVTKIVRALQCALNVLLVVVSAATAIAAAVARWTDLLDFDGEPIIGSQREISSILNDTMFQELMVAVFIPSVIVLFIAMVGIAGSYVVTGKGRSKAKLQMSSIFRIIYAVLLAVTLLIEGIIACLLTWFFVGHNVGSFAGNECPYPEFSQDQAIDMLKCPIDYAIKEYILDYPPAWSTLQDTWYMCGYYCGSNDYCSDKDASNQWQTTGRFCSQPVPRNATMGIFAVYTGNNSLVPATVSTQPLRPTIFNFIGSITLPTTVFFWIVFAVSACLLANTCIIGRQQNDRLPVVGHSSPTRRYGRSGARTTRTFV